MKIDRIVTVTPVPVFLSQNVSITKKRDKCLYHDFMAYGLPAVGVMNLREGSSLQRKTENWLAANWYQSQAIMGRLVDFLRNNPQDREVYHHAYDETHAKGARGILDFILNNVDTIHHLSSGFDFQKGYNPFIPRVSQEVKEMSFAERQQLLRVNNAARLDEVKKPS